MTYSTVSDFSASVYMEPIFNPIVVTVSMDNSIQSIKRMSTLNQGITSDKYITYLKLNRTSVELPI